MGSFRVQFTIVPSGKVTKVQEVTSRVKDKGFKKAVMEEVYKWRFPEARAGSISLNYTFLFVPSGMDAATVTRWEQATSARNPERVDIGKAPEGTRKSVRPGKDVTYLPSIPKVPPLPTKSPQETSPMAQIANEKSNLGTYEVLYTTPVFNEPRNDSPVVSTVEVGTRVNVVGFQGDWLEIRSKHGRPPGFIPKDSATPESTRRPQETGTVSTKESSATQYRDTYGDRGVVRPGGPPIHVGPRGGLYHYSGTGTKVYHSRSTSSRSFGSRRR